jgi:hypothetical protein
MTSVFFDACTFFFLISFSKMKAKHCALKKIFTKLVSFFISNICFHLVFFSLRSLRFEKNKRHTVFRATSTAVSGFSLFFFQRPSTYSSEKYWGDDSTPPYFSDAAHDKQS